MLSHAREQWQWAVAAIVAVYLFTVTRTWHLPNYQGVPYPPVWAAASIALLAGRRRARGRLEAVEAIAIMALVGMVLTDLTVFWSEGLRDLRLDLKAGEHFLSGQPVYQQTVLAARPADLTDYPFLYPPVTLPLFGALAVLPTLVAECLAVAASIGASIVGLRLLGLDLRWSVVMLIWPPFQQGIYVGNVAVPLFILFAAAPWMAAGLSVLPLFKLQGGVATLWQLRERRWKAFAAGAALVVAACLVTLPVVGIGQWQAWLNGLALYRTSQTLLPEYLYGFGLPRFVPYPLFVAVAAIAVLVALVPRGREGLSRLGLATVVASPSLFVHGMLVALPALLTLRTVWFWTAMAITASAPGLGWWAAIGLMAAAWFLPGLRRDAAAIAATSGPARGPGVAGGPAPAATSDPLHPLPPGFEPWPSAPFARPIAPEPPAGGTADARDGPPSRRAA